MADPEPLLNLDQDPEPKAIPWAPILGVAAFIGFGLLAFWLTREKKNEQAREAIIVMLDKELGNDQDAIKIQREKVMELTRQVETLRSNIQLGQGKKGQAAVEQFNALARDQRTERDKFAQMAEAYNKKVAKLRELSE